MASHAARSRLLPDDDIPGTGRYVWQPGDGMLRWSEGLVRMFGRAGAPASAAEALSCLHPDDRARIEGENRALTAAATADSYSRSFRIRRPDGAERVILDRGRVRRGADGHPREIRGIAIDITDPAPPPMREQRRAGTGHPGLSGVTPGCDRARQGRSAAAMQASERRLGLLLRLSDALRACADPRAAMKAASRLLGGEFGAAHVGFAEVDAQGMVRTEAEFAPGDELARLIAEPRPLASFGRRMARQLQAGGTVCVQDIDTDPAFSPDERAAIRATGLRSFIVAPVVSDGRLEACLFAAEDSPRHWDAQDIALLRDAAARTHETVLWARTDAASRENEARYQALFQRLDSGFCVTEVRLDPAGAGPAADYRVIEANPAFFDLTGFPQAILGQWLRRAAPDLEDHWYAIYGEVARSGEPRRVTQQSAMMGCWFDVYAFRIDGPGLPRVAILFTDISDRVRHEDRAHTLLKEMNHRAKNMLSLVTVIARRTASAAGGSEDFIERFSDRIDALAKNQDILVRSDWRVVDLAALIRGQLAHFEDLLGRRIQVEGPAVPVIPAAAEPLGMALHELATNAAKYGALSTDSGHVRITWDSTPAEGGGAARLVLRWGESGGPPVTAPEATGFGSLVSGGLLEMALTGSVSAEFAPAGLQWRLTCPLSAVSGG